MNTINHYIRIRDGRMLVDGKEELHVEPAFDVLMKQAYQTAELKYPKFHKMDDLSKLTFIGAEYLLKHATLPDNKEDIGLILANRSSSFDTDIKFQKSMEDIASPALFVYTLPNIALGEVSIRHGFKGENAFFVSEQFDVEFVYDYVSDLLNKKYLSACLTGWVELGDDGYDLFLMLVQNNGDGEAFEPGIINQLYSQ